MSGPGRIITIINSIPQPWRLLIVELVDERDKAKADLQNPAVLAALPEVQALILTAEARALAGVTTLHTVIADIRAATVGSKPMLSELAAALVAWRDEAVAAEREACAALADKTADKYWRSLLITRSETEVEVDDGKMDAAFEIAAAIRKRGEG